MNTMQMIVEMGRTMADCAPGEYGCSVDQAVNDVDTLSRALPNVPDFLEHAWALIVVVGSLITAGFKAVGKWCRGLFE